MTKSKKQIVAPAQPLAAGSVIFEEAPHLGQEVQIFPEGHDFKDFKYNTPFVLAAAVDKHKAFVEEKRFKEFFDSFCEVFAKSEKKLQKVERPN